MSDMITEHYPHKCISFLITKGMHACLKPLLPPLGFDLEANHRRHLGNHRLIARKHILYPPFIALSLILAPNRYMEELVSLHAVHTMMTQELHKQKQHGNEMHMSK
eukprot:1055517_1